MIAFCNTLGQLRRALERWIELLGEDTPVGTEYANVEPRKLLRFGPDGQAEEVDYPADYYLDEGLSLDWVVIEKELGRIVGSEAEDTETKRLPGTVNAVRIG